MNIDYQIIYWIDHIKYRTPLCKVMYIWCFFIHCLYLATLWMNGLETETVRGFWQESSYAIFFNSSILSFPLYLNLKLYGINVLLLFVVVKYLLSFFKELSWTFLSFFSVCFFLLQFLSMFTTYTFYSLTGTCTPAQLRSYTVSSTMQKSCTLSARVSVIEHTKPDFDCDIVVD